MVEAMYDVQRIRFVHPLVVAGIVRVLIPRVVTVTGAIATADITIIIGLILVFVAPILPVPLLLS